MKRGSVRSSIACGLSAVIASVSLMGCAGAPVINRPMHTVDLDAFQIDCARRDEQVRLLLGMLSTEDDRILSFWTNYMKPWGEYTGDQHFALRRDIYSRMTNWQIGQNLRHIKYYCG